MTDYEPRTVAVATVRGTQHVRVLRDGPYRGWVTAEVIGHSRWHPDHFVTDVHPLVLLDPDQCPYGLTTKAWWLRRLADEDADRVGGGTPRLSVLRWVVDQIEAQTLPPKPAEPTGWLAVVEALNGGRWYRELESGECPWRQKRADGIHAYDRWADLPPTVRVVSEGITP